jgi:hypothetical protein
MRGNNVRAMALFGALLSGLNCQAQPPGPPPPPPPLRERGPLPPGPGEQGSRTTVSGVVRSFTYGPGGVDGLILDRGTVIHFSPEYGSQVNAAVQVGTAVAVSGWSHPGPAGDTVFDAETITNQSSRASIVMAAVAPPPPPGPPPVPGSAAFAGPPPAPPPLPPSQPTPTTFAPAVQSVVVTGTVRSLNYGIDGQVNGLILSDGTAVYFPPELGSQVLGAVSVSARIRVTGWPRTGPAGNRLMDAQVIANPKTGASLIVTNTPLAPAP